jgi:hypothetical protein
MSDTPWIGWATNRLFLQSGQFSSTLKTSEDVSATEGACRGISWDGTNTPWCGVSGGSLLRLQSGQFTSTIKDTQSVNSLDLTAEGLTWDGTNTPWIGSQADKLYLQSGQFTSTLKTSQSVNSVDSWPTGISWDGVNTPWIGLADDKLYLQSGQFTSTLKTSESIVGIDDFPRGISYDGTNTPWCGNGDRKLYLQSGQFTSTLKTSQSNITWDTSAIDISTNDVTARLGSDTATSAVVFTQEAVSTLTAVIDTPWCGTTDKKLYLQSGQFTSTLRTSEYVGGIAEAPNGISFDKTNTPWSSGVSDKLYLQSGQFTSTIKVSEYVGGTDSNLQDISWDGTNTPWCGESTDKLYVQSGQFTSTIKISGSITGIDTVITGISWDGIDTPWCGIAAIKLYLQSGQFTSTLKDSEYVGGHDNSAQGISGDGANTFWVGKQFAKLYVQSGHFTSTIKTSESIVGIDTAPRGICTNSVDKRVLRSCHIEIVSSSITFSQDDTLAQRPIYLTVSNSVAYTQEARVPDELSAEAINTLTFTQSISRAGTQYFTASNVLNFLSEADATLNGITIYSRFVQQVIDFTQESTDVIPFKVARAESTLTFTQFILAIFPQSVTASSLLEFLQGIKYSPVSVFAESDLAEIIWTVPEDGNVTLEPTGFQQTIGLIQIAGQAPPDSRINFEQNADVVHIRDADGISKVAENTVTFSQFSDVTYGGDSNITFTQTTTADLCKPTKSVLTFTQDVDLESITTRTASNVVEFQQSAFHSLTRDGELCNAQGRVVPELPHYDNVQFAYPLTSVTHTLTLRGPELGNRERMQFQRINRETRGGTLIVFADPIWPKNDHLVMDFVGLSETETNQVRSFIKTTLGKQVTLRDWEGRNWVGVIVSPNNPIVRDGALCMNTVAIELEGHAGYDTTASSTVEFTQTAVGTKT